MKKRHFHHVAEQYKAIGANEEAKELARHLRYDYKKRVLRKKRSKT